MKVEIAGIYDQSNISKFFLLLNQISRTNFFFISKLIHFDV